MLPPNTGPLLRMFFTRGRLRPGLRRALFIGARRTLILGQHTTEFIAGLLGPLTPVVDLSIRQPRRLSATHERPVLR